MISTLITLLVYLLVLGVVYWVVTMIVGMMGLPAPAGRIIQVIFGLLALLLILGLFFGGVSLPRVNL